MAQRGPAEPQHAGVKDGLLPEAAGNGTISAAEFKNALAKMGQYPTEEELFVMIQQVHARGGRRMPHAARCAASKPRALRVPAPCRRMAMVAAK